MDGRHFDLTQPQPQDASIASISFRSVIELGSRLPVAVRVHRDSRDLILPLYPLHFTGKLAQNPSDTEIEFDEWVSTVQRVAPPTNVYAIAAKAAKYKAVRRQNLSVYSTLRLYTEGIRVNAKLDTVVVPDYTCWGHHPLSLLYSFGGFEHKSKIHNLAIDWRVWEGLLKNKKDEHGWKDILAEYKGLKTLCIIGSTQKPLQKQEQHSVLKETQDCLAELGEAWKRTSVDTKRNYTVLACHVTGQAIVLERAEREERERLREERRRNPEQKN